MSDPRAGKGSAEVDYLVDENAAHVELEEDTLVRPAAKNEVGIGSIGPTNWWRIGLIAVGIVAAILLAMQLLGGTPGTDVQPGTPTAQQENAPVL